MSGIALLLLALGAGSGMTLEVDLREAPRRLVHARMAIPARPGPLVLVYPKWIPGNHGPTGPLADLSGLRVSARGAPLAWTRDPVDLHAFRVEVPPGAEEVEVSLDLLGARAFTPHLATLRWSSALLYPRGADPAGYPVRASLRLPPGWSWGAALDAAAEEGGRVAFAPVSLETLIDSPVLAGQHLRAVALGPAAGPPHRLVLAGETPEALELPAVWKERMERLLAEAQALFGGRHFRRYDFLLALSDHDDHGGLEHHQSSDNHVPEKFLRSPKVALSRASLLAHEYVHSWNGKYRRPRGLATPDLQEPMRTGELWIYEGLTHYLGMVLAARTGTYAPEEMREALATVAAAAAEGKGREWRPLGDAGTATPVLQQARPAWASWRRSWRDSYGEGVLLWLEADVAIREASGGARSLDDFCRSFFGGDGPPEVRPYDVAELAAALERVEPLGWGRFFAERVSAVRAEPPVAGLTRGGWRVASAARPGPYFQAREAEAKLVDLRASLGLTLGAEKADVLDVVPGSPADRAGLAPGARLVAVNGRRHGREVLEDAVAATPRTGRVELLVEDADFFRTFALEYRGGPRYPALERDPSRPDLLAAILAPRAAAPTPARPSGR